MATEKITAHNVFDTLLQDTADCIQSWDSGKMAKVSRHMTNILYALNAAKDIAKQQLWDNLREKTE